MPDGYHNLQDLIKNQIKISKELIEASDELNSIPEMPKNLDKWIDSIPNDKSKFKLADYSKLFKVGRKYNQLVEKQEANAGKLKVVMIEELLEKIKEVLGE